MKKTLLVSCFCMFISFCSFSQTTYLTDTAFTTDVGFGGAPASCVFTGGYYLGFWMDANRDYSIADVFTVPFSSTWAFDTVILYGYQDGSTMTSPFTAAYLQIYAGGPPDGGGTLVWGDTTTNLLSGTGFTGIYRVDTFSSGGGLNNTSWPIMYLKLYLSPFPSLPANTYWLRWSTLASGTGRINCPPKVLPGRINPSGQQAKQDSSGRWYTLSYNGQHSGFSKIVKASAAVASVAKIIKPPVISLSQNTPNPFKGNTQISFYTPQDGGVKLTVYNSAGQLVATLVDGYLNTGEYTVTLDAGQLAPGVYYYQLNTNAASESKEMLVK